MRTGEGARVARFAAVDPDSEESVSDRLNQDEEAVEDGEETTETPETTTGEEQ